MVPKVPRKGASFKGAALYYLHDKNALTSNRVAFTHTENLPTLDPDKAIRLMAHTAMHQDEIKQRAGGSAKGRKLALPVYSYSLSWHPEENPTQDDMIAAGKASLKAIGLHEGYEVLMVSHNDEPHPHIHIIVNRVHPETGIAAPLSKDWLKLSRWAEAYERERGKIYCEERVKNNERRLRGEFIKQAAERTKETIYDWRRQRLEDAFELRQSEARGLSAAHRAQRQALYRLKEYEIRQRHQAIRDHYRPRWRAVFDGQRQERLKQEEARVAANERLKYFLANKNIDRFGGDRKSRAKFMTRAFNIMDRDRAQAAALKLKQASERAVMAEGIRILKKEATREINAKYREELDKLRQRQQDQQQNLAAEHSQQSQDAARDIKTGADAEEYRKDRRRGLSRTFHDRAKGAGRDAGRDGGQDRGRERSRDRDRDDD